MYKACSPTILEDMEKNGKIIISIKEGYEMSGAWTAKPINIFYYIGNIKERIFECYYHERNKVVQITNIKPTQLIADQSNLVDGYMYIVLKGLIEFAKSTNAKKIIVDSKISSITDHMLDLNFESFSVGGQRACKHLED